MSTIKIQSSMVFLAGCLLIAVAASFVIDSTFEKWKRDRVEPTQPLPEFNIVDVTQTCYLKDGRMITIQLRTAEPYGSTVMSCQLEVPNKRK